MKKQPAPLETLVLDQLPDDAMPAYEAALLSVSATIALYLDEETGNWRIEAVREALADQDALQAALALAAGLTGHEAPLTRHATESEGWLARMWNRAPPMAASR
jgi:ribosomal protein L11 methyltransferase